MSTHTTVFTFGSNLAGTARSWRCLPDRTTIPFTASVTGRTGNGYVITSYRG